MDWREQAECLDIDPELFFPIGPTGLGLQQAHEAKKICRRCPVQQSCLEWALANGQQAGIWGGTDEDERRLLRRRARQARQAVG